MVGIRNRLPKDGVPVLEVFKGCGDVVLRGMVSGGLGSIRLMVGHGDLKGLF